MALLTTVGRNPGDERIADGVARLLLRLGSEAQRFRRISKHDPLSMFPALGVRRRLLVRRPPGVLVGLGNWLGLNALHSADLIVHCGTPLLWDGCETAGWVAPILNTSLGHPRRTAPVLNLGLGASYPWEAQPERLTLAEAAYARAVCGMASVTTVRDAVAASLLRSADVVARVLPCPALFALPAAPADAPIRPTVLVNYMRLAGHYDGAQNIDEAAWRQEVRRLLAIMSRNGVDHLFATVGKSERDLAERHFPQSPRVTLSSLAEIEAAARRVSFAVVNRLHIAIPLAGAGIPSVMVGNDCRMKAMEPLGLDLMYVKDATADALYEAVERGLRNADAREPLLELRRGAERNYLALLREATGW